jgi:hypothetical protein
MKKCTIIILSVILLSMKSDDDRKTLLCHKWISFGYKQNTSLSLIAIDSSKHELFFKKDGTYKELVNEHQSKFKITGTWFFNSDQTKLGMEISTINGKKLPPDQDSTKRTKYIILKLTKDTLIYEDEQPLVYYKFDWYLARKK